MNGIIYKMTKEMYDTVSTIKRDKGPVKRMSYAETLEYVNKTFGLKGKIIKIELVASAS